ncbi:nitrogenase component 1 [Caldinitratiruptor microaerophilus]|uniref:Nitrogenase/oxidoreductase component 1 domain-containing protein n=1 Tax=Caldinitratiruptor microaerophilus TaxID=671077 RepID=A0AA35CJ31_9FIRM|nr:nitrogenase component 1 [Caldinitratiruptor microaerophilus]BDG59293.1 hypothetical protein caldi_03830 [Caldinitratiruptor microaerophilus]
MTGLRITMPQPTDYLGTVWALAGVEGLRVIGHGASGCTFYDFIGLRDLQPAGWPPPLFSTGLEEAGVVLGGEERLAEAVRQVDRLDRPEVIALVNVTVGGLIGADPEAVARELQPHVGAKLLGFGGGGYRGPYTLGESEALAALAAEVVQRAPLGGEEQGPLVNLIGATWEMFNWASDRAELERLLGLLGVRVGTVLAAGTSVAALRRAGGAHLNLVVRDVGLEAAEILRQRFGTPYLYGLPFGASDTRRWLEEVAGALGIGGRARDAVERDLRRYRVDFRTLSPWRDVHHDLRVAICTPYDYALGLTRLLSGEWGLPVALVVLPVPPLGPGPDPAGEAVRRLQEAGAARVLVAPDEQELATALTRLEPHVLLGSSDDERLAPHVPVRVRAALPSWDQLHFHDGTPFVGPRGARYVAQVLAGGMLTARATGRWPD